MHNCVRLVRAALDSTTSAHEREARAAAQASKAAQTAGAVLQVRAEPLQARKTRTACKGPARILWTLRVAAAVAAAGGKSHAHIQAMQADDHATESATVTAQLGT